MQRFMIDAERILVSDGETIEFFWRGTTNGSSKWRFHVVHAAAELTPKRKGDEIAVKLGESSGRGVSGDVSFDLSVGRADELTSFLAQAGVAIR